MLNANLILIALVIYKLLKNHYSKTKGVTYVVLLILSAYTKVIAEAFPITEIEGHPILLRLVLLQGVIGFLPVPITLLFLKDAMSRNSKPALFHILLLIPFVFCLINLMPYFGLPIQEKIQISTNLNTSLPQDYFLWISMPTINYVSNIYNPILAFLTILYLTKNLLQKRQKLGKKTFNLLIQIGFIFVINYLALSFITYNKTWHIGEMGTSETLGILAMILPISILLFPNLIYDISINADLNNFMSAWNPNAKKDLSHRPINGVLLAESERIMKYLNEDKPYMNPAFSIHDIVSTLNIPQKNVRECFSQVIKTPFPKMRNQLRVEFAIEMFKKNAHLNISIEGIAAESGFNNRVTFYQAFREVTNTTPVQWIKENCTGTLETE
jgi:AraC-like DNA-binding protein